MKHNNNSHKQIKGKSHFMWALTGIIFILFLMFFVNGYLVHTQTGVDDTDISLFQ